MQLSSLESELTYYQLSCLKCCSDPFFSPLMHPSLFARTRPDAPRLDSGSSSPVERPVPLKAKRSHRRADPDAAHRYTSTHTDTVDVSVDEIYEYPAKTPTYSM